MKTQVGTIITPEGIETIIRPADGKHFSLDELQKAVGGYIEHVLLRPGNGHAYMYCNEDGKSLKLPRNDRATRMARIAREDYIVGSIIIVRTEARPQ